MDEPPDHGSPDGDDLGSLASLDDPTRRRLYDHVVARDTPTSRDQAAAALGIDRALAAYHLDRLADEGLLRTSFARPDGRSGPGAGRPAKHYARAAREFSVSVPPRHYLLAAEVFARAADSDATGTLRRALEEAATAVGRQLVAGAADDRDVVDHLRRQGFEPYADGGTTRLRNCPFHQLARAHTELVCGMNLAMLTGLVDALGVDVRPRLDPAPDRCCVALDGVDSSGPARSANPQI